MISVDISEKLLSPHILRPVRFDGLSIGGMSARGTELAMGCVNCQASFKLLAMFDIVLL